MDSKTRKFYDGLILWARLENTPDDFETWYYENYQVSSSVHPSGMFYNYKEQLQYENRWEQYCKHNGIDLDTEL